jgi:hypothetical protein
VKKLLLLALALISFATQTTCVDRTKNGNLILAQASKQYPEDKVIKAIATYNIKALQGVFVDPHNFFQIDVSTELLIQSCPEFGVELKKMPEGQSFDGASFIYDYLGMALLMACQAAEGKDQKKQIISQEIIKELLARNCSPNVTQCNVYFINGRDYICFLPIMSLVVDLPEILELLLKADGRVDCESEDDPLLNKVKDPASRALLVTYKEKQKDLPAVAYRYVTGEREGQLRNLWISGKLDKKECSCVAPKKSHLSNAWATVKKYALPIAAVAGLSTIVWCMKRDTNPAPDKG